MTQYDSFLLVIWAYTPLTRLHLSASLCASFSSTSVSSHEWPHDRCLIIYRPNRRLSYQEHISRRWVAVLYRFLASSRNAYSVGDSARLYLAEKYANEVLCPIPVALFSLTGQQERQEGVSHPVPDPRNAPWPK